MRAAVDMEEVVKSVRNYTAVSGLKDPAHIVSNAELPEVLTDLQHALYKRGVAPEKCAYWMHPNVHKDLINHEDMVKGGVSAYAFRGRSIRIAPQMPEDVILFAAPDAIGMGGKVYNPLIVAYAELQDNE